ncbi:C40 family peptidase [Candidatus Woesearchaeota archaeon]|nr:C40 family peptidase [Candidatus Woesearchaeota archaeon]
MRLKNLLQGLGLVALLAQEKPKYEINEFGKTYAYATEEQKKLVQDVLQVATNIENTYRNFPYVWGGDGFEPLAEQRKKYVKHKCVTDVQPTKPHNWRSGLKTVPGVDCAGLIFQTILAFNALKDQKVNLPYGRLTAKGYKTTTEEVVKPGYNNLKEIVDKARPADLVFKHEADGVSHIMFYMGNGVVLESAGKKDRSLLKPVPKKDMDEWKTFFWSRSPGKTDDERLENYGGIQATFLNKKYEKEALSVGRWKEFKEQPKKEEK